MKVTILAGYFPPEQSADTRLNSDLASGLAELGAEVTLIVPFPTRAVDCERQQEYLNRRVEVISENLRVIRVGKPGKYRPSLFFRALSLLEKTAAIYRQAKKTETDVYLAVSTPPFLGYAAAMLAKKKPTIFKLQDVFPDSLLRTKHWEEKNIAIKVLRMLEKQVYRSVALIVAISDDIKRTLLERDVAEDKIAVIYDWVDETQCYSVPRSQNHLFEEFGLSKDKFYVCYAGNIGFLQHLDTVVRASEILAKKDSPIQFVIIGDGAWKPKLDEMLRGGSHDNVHCFPMQPMDQIAYVYSLGDIGLVSLQPNITRYALPSKTWNILSAGRPAVCEIDLYSKLCDILEENGCGCCVSPGDADTLAEILQTMYEDAEKMARMGKRAREYVERNMTKKVACKKYYDKLISLTRY